MIALSSNQTQVIEEYNWKFPHPLRAPLAEIEFRGSKLKVRISPGMFDTEYVGAFDGDKLAGLLTIYSPEGPLPYHHVGKSLVHQAYKGERITRQLIEWWVGMNGKCLASDENQTFDGAHVWESMILRGGRLDFFLWHPTEPLERLAIVDGKISPDPWLNPHSRLLACPAK
jgi:hypothetical protein